MLILNLMQQHLETDMGNKNTGEVVEADHTLPGKFYWEKGFLVKALVS